MKELRKAFPREVPIIDDMIKTLSKNVEKIKDLECQMEAILKYNASCAKAMAKLTEDLKKCLSKK